MKLIICFADCQLKGDRKKIVTERDLDIINIFNSVILLKKIDSLQLISFILIFILSNKSSGCVTQTHMGVYLLSQISVKLKHRQFTRTWVSTNVLEAEILIYTRQ